MDKDWLFNQYVTQERSVSQIAEDLKVSNQLIIEWLNRFDIYRDWRRSNIKPIKKH